MEPLLPGKARHRGVTETCCPFALHSILCTAGHPGLFTHKHKTSGMEEQPHSACIGACAASSCWVTREQYSGLYAGHRSDVWPEYPCACPSGSITPCVPSSLSASEFWCSTASVWSLFSSLILLLHFWKTTATGFKIRLKLTSHASEEKKKTILSTASAHLTTYVHLGFEHLWEWSSPALSFHLTSVLRLQYGPEPTELKGQVHCCLQWSRRKKIQHLFFMTFTYLNEKNGNFQPVTFI